MHLLYKILVSLKKKGQPKCERSCSLWMIPWEEKGKLDREEERKEGAKCFNISWSPILYRD